jgi:DNA-directed RNA polymerase subunit RPC12/RpoP
MRNRVSFSCSTCHARLRASLEFVGRACPCPRCGQDVVVPPRAPEEQAPLLVFDDDSSPRRTHFARA